MPDMPAVCDNCGTIFPSGFFVENATNITFASNTSGPCPNCGAMGHVLDGTFNFTKDTIQLLQGPQRTISALERLAVILQEARESNASTEEVRQTIQQETPELAPLANLLPQNRAELYAFIAIILTTIQILLDTTNAQQLNISDVDIDVNQIINITIEQQPSPNP